MSLSMAVLLWFLSAVRVSEQNGTRQTIALVLRVAQHMRSRTCTHGRTHAPKHQLCFASVFFALPFSTHGRRFTFQQIDHFPWPTDFGRCHEEDEDPIGLNHWRRRASVLVSQRHPDRMGGESLEHEQRTDSIVAGDSKKSCRHPEC